MGAIADHVATMRGRSLADICAQIERMEAAALDVGADDFSTLWDMWPDKTAKKAAEKAYKAARKRGVSRETIAAGMLRYRRDKPADRPWLHLATFINGERWLDQPAVVSGPPLKGLAAERAQLQQEIANGDGRTTQASADHRHAHRLGQPDQGYEPRRLL